MMDEYDDVRAKLTEIIQRYGLRPTDIARDVGLHHSSLALWMQEKIKGHKVEIDKAIANFLDSFLANKCRWNSHLPKLALLKANKEFDECNVPSYDDADSLIPIKLDLEYEDKQLKDAFIWDKREQYLTVDMFARILVEEHNLPPIFEQEVINEMKKKLTLSTRYISGECIKTININVRIGEIIVRDQFEWDICNTENSPEDFASVLATDLGLSSEFILPIACSIRDQVQEARRNMLFEKENEKKDITTAIRNGQDLVGSSVIFDQYKLSDNYKGGWGPYVGLLTDEELRKLEKQEERNDRYAKRKKQE